MRYILFITFFAIALSSYASIDTPLDSVGIEEVNGKKYILHKVESEETLYSLSRRYNVSIPKIIESNPPTEFGLEVGQIIKIPFLDKRVKKNKSEKENPRDVPNRQAPAKSLTHTVKAKETLFSISRMYSVTVDQIKDWNNLESNSIDIGQVLIVGTGQKDDSATKVNDNKNTAPQHSNAKIHTVEQSETLYAISRKYNVTIDELKEWNKLESNEISIGQQLVVGKGEKPVQMSDSLVQTGDNSETMLTQTEQEKDVKEKRSMVNPIITDKSTSVNFEEVVESGLAALIEGSENTRKYLALHRTAKVGTIMRVKNEMNDQEVFVRVLGKLPDTGVNDNVVLRISKSAYDRLGAIDKKFRVTITYIP